MNPSSISIQLHLKSTWSLRHGHYAEAELPFDPTNLEAVFSFNGQTIQGIKLWGAVEGTKPGHKVYRWGIRTRFAFSHLFTWNKQELWNLELTPANDSSSTTWKGNSMAKVEASPEEIESFASTLDRFGKTLHSEIRQLNAAQKRLGETWRDQENARYAQEFEQALRILDRFIQESAQQVPQLKRKAQRLRDYLQQR